MNADGDTMTGSLIIGRPVDGNAPTLNIVGAFSRATATSPGIVDITGPINTAANQAALTIRRHNDTVDYFHVTGDVGGGTDDRPGLLIGLGGTTFHDVNLYRSSANVLKTDDAFVAATLGLSVGTIDGQNTMARLATTQGNLGIIPGAITAVAVENWALTANSLADIAFSKLPNIVRDITQFSYEASARKYRLKIHRNDGNAIATVDTAAHPAWITAAALTQANLYDAVAAIIAQGSNITLTPDATNHVVTIAGPAPGMGATAFLSLSDTPTTFASQAGKFAAVNAATDALEFVDAPSGGGGDDTLAVLLEALNGDGTNDLPVTNPVGGTTDQDYLLIYDKSGGIIARTGVGDLAAILPTSVSANPGLVATDGDLTSLNIGGTSWRIPVGVSANPTLVDTDGTLTGLTIGGTNWHLPIGVVANPGGTGLTDLNTITIGTESYAIAGSGGVPVPPEILYEDTSDGGYPEDSWINLNGFRALAADDDTKLIEVRCQVNTPTFTDYDFFYFPVETFRGMDFNTSTTVAANNAVRFKTLRTDTSVNSWSHSSFWVSRRDATTWGIGMGHQIYKRFRFRLLTANGTVGARGLPGTPGIPGTPGAPGGTVVTANPSFVATEELTKLAINTTVYSIASLVGAGDIFAPNPTYQVGQSSINLNLPDAQDDKVNYRRYTFIMPSGVGASSVATTQAQLRLSSSSLPSLMFDVDGTGYRFGGLTPNRIYTIVWLTTGSQFRVVSGEVPIVNAAQVQVDTSQYPTGGILSSTDATVQIALVTLANFTATGLSETQVDARIDALVPSANNTQILATRSAHAGWDDRAQLDGSEHPDYRAGVDVGRDRPRCPVLLRPPGGRN